jgi:hypothetical protein
VIVLLDRKTFTRLSNSLLSLNLRALAQNSLYANAAISNRRSYNGLRMIRPGVIFGEGYICALIEVQ